MIVAVDLNASPVPEDDENDFGGQVEEYHAPEERVETAVDIARRVPFPLLLCISFHLIMSWWCKLALIHAAVYYYGSFSFIAVVHAYEVVSIRIFVGFGLDKPFNLFDWSFYC